MGATIGRVVAVAGGCVGSVVAVGTVVGWIAVGATVGVIVGENGTVGDGGGMGVGLGAHAITTPANKIIANKLN